MQADAELTLKNLHVVGALAHNDKLLTNEDTFDIYAPTSVRGLYRYWYHERRAQNMTRIRQTIQRAMQFVERTLEDAHAVASSSSPTAIDLRLDTTVTYHVRMSEALGKACGGLRNMLQTYRDDATLSSQIGLTITEITDFLALMAPRTEALRRQCSPQIAPTQTSFLPPYVAFDMPPTVTTGSSDSVGR